MPKNKERRKVKLPVEDYGDLVELLEGRKESLSKRLQQVAQFCLNNPENVALYNIIDLAGQAEVAPSAITRFSKELGFSGFNDFQHVFRQRLVGPKVTYADRVRIASGNDSDKIEEHPDLGSPSAIFNGLVRGGIDSLVRLSEDIDHKVMNEFVQILDTASCVHIVTSRGAFGVGNYCYYGFSRIGVPTHLIDNVGSMRAEQFSAVQEDDVVLAITFDDYTPETIEIANLAHEKNRTLLVITDNELSPIAKIGNQTLYVKEGRLGHFRSQVPAMVLCQSIIMSVAKSRSTAGSS